MVYPWFFSHFPYVSLHFPTFPWDLQQLLAELVDLPLKGSDLLPQFLGLEAGTSKMGMEISTKSQTTSRCGYINKYYIDKHCINNIYIYIYICNVNPGLINHGLLIRGGTPPIVIIQYLNGTPPINQPRGLLIQG